MVKTNILLESIADVKEFVSTVTLYDFDVDLVSGRYAVDAKSIMGISALTFPTKSNLLLIQTMLINFLME